MWMLMGLGCTTEDAAGGPAPLRVEGVGVAEGVDERRVVAATEARVRGEAVTVGFTPLLAAGEPVGDEVFGMLHARDGTPLRVCDGLDYTGLWRTPEGLRMVTHFECQPGAIYLTDVDTSGDVLVAGKTRPLDLTAIDGGGLFCSGSETPWGTHLAGEEYEGDVRQLLPDGTLADDFEHYNALAAWWGGSLAKAHPWDYGWMVEATPSGQVERRWAMGRFSHELGVVMPDQRTVYLTDDATNGVLFRFVADVPGDLTAGTLYAARWVQRSESSADLGWVSLGHADDAEVEAAVRARVPFEALFDTDVPGCVPTLVNWGRSCLRVRPAMAAVASRLEARRFAAVRGATTEWLKTEGLAWDGDGERLLLAVSRIGRGMLAGDPEWDLPERDDIRLPENPCGAVLALPVDAAYTATRADVLVAGVPAGDGCAADGIANPDNLAWLDGLDTLAIAEDTSLHRNNVLWLLDGEGRLTRALSAPVGAEVSGLHYTVDEHDRGWLSVAIQHPLVGLPATERERRSLGGVFGPFPAAP